MADDLCRVLKSELNIILIDDDRVEPHNLKRQNFYAGDVGKFKSQVLAERLSRQYGRKIAYSVYPYNAELGSDVDVLGFRSLIKGLLIGCVDQYQSRQAIAATLEGPYNWWIDAGNGEHSGQVLIGNLHDTSYLNGAFLTQEKVAACLPAPHIQLPGLLLPPSVPVKAQDCAEAVEDNTQSPIINRVMASWVTQFVYHFFNGTLPWMGVYVDTEMGTTSTVPAEPETVARMLKMKVSKLTEDKRCSRGIFKTPRTAPEVQGEQGIFEQEE